MLCTIQIQQEAFDEKARALLATKRASDIKSECVKLLPPDLRASILDIWDVRQLDDSYSFRMRVLHDAVSTLLSLSGAHRIWVDTPKEIQNDIKLTWLRKREGAGYTWFTLTEAIKLYSSHNNRGLIRRKVPDGYQFAIRCTEEQHPAIKTSLGLSAKRAWLLEGAPIEMSTAELQPIVAKSLQWNGIEMEADTARIRRGKMSCIVRSDAQPAYSAFPLMCGNDLYSITVRPKEKMKEPEAIPVKATYAAESWDDALIAKYVQPADEKEVVPKNNDESQASKRPRSALRTSAPSTSPVTIVAAPIDELKADMAMLKEQMAALVLQLAGGAMPAGVKRQIDQVPGAAQQEHPDAMHH